MKNAFVQTLISTEKFHDKIVFLTVDQSTGFDAELEKLLGKRFIIEAISEQSVTGFASGLAADGYIPIVFNHTAFTIRRSYEQVLLDCCLQERKVIFLGMGGGFATAHLGPSHTTFDDVALTRVMPNMTVFVPGDAAEIRSNFDKLMTSKESVYIRLSKYGKPPLADFQFDDNSTIGYKKYPAGSGDRAGNVCIISTGPISVNVSAALDQLTAKEGTLFTHIHVPFIKPLDTATLLKLTAEAEQVLIFEEHSVIGGLGSACAEAFATAPVAGKRQVKLYGVKDMFIHKYGSQEEIWKHLGLDKDSIQKTIEETIAG